VTALAAALRADPAPEVRRAAARSLGGIGGESAVAALSGAAAQESEVTVRAEIVHALAGQGGVARAALERIAEGDADAGVRNLARTSLRPLRGPGN
jgi:HEAT repeat protein